MNFAERFIYDHLNVRQAGVLEFAGPCTGKECKTCMHFNEKISELTQSSDTKKPTPSNLSKAKQLRSLKKKHRSARTASINWDDFSKNLEEHKGREESFEGVQKGMDLDAKGFRVHDFFDKILKGEISTKGDTRNSKPIDYTLDGHPEENIEHHIKNPVSEEKSWGNYEVHGVYSDHGISNSDSDFKHKVWASSSHDAIKKVKEKIYGGYTPEMNSNKKEDNLYKAHTLDLAGEKAPLFNPFTGMVETTHPYSSTNGWLHNFDSLGHLGENQIHLAVRKDPS